MSRFTPFALLVCAGTLAAAPPDPAPAQAKAAIARLPLRFEENRGQIPSSARYIARATNFDVEFMAAGPAMAIGTRRVDLKLLGANATAAMTAEDRMAASTNYMVGTR